MTPPTLTEHEEQALLFRWAAWFGNTPHCPKVDVGGAKRPVTDFLHAVPNGGYRNIKTAAILKTEGVKRGVPDVVLPYPCGKYHGLYIEMKRKKGGTLSREQRLWLEYLNSVGYLAVCCKGFEQASAVIKKYLNKEI